MSRAFVKEDGPEETRLPDLPVSALPNYVTPRGLQQLQSRLSAAQATLAALRARDDRLDRHPEAVAARDIRWLEARLRSAIPVPQVPAPRTAAFGVCVTCRDDSGAAQTWAIVGEDEADAALGLLSVHAPLARALIGAEVGDAVTWRAGGRTVTLDVVALHGAGPERQGD